MNPKFSIAPLIGSLALAFAGGPASAQSLIRNPSFESNYNDGFPHYSSIDEWTGGSGVNEAAGPFHNGGTPIPDQNRVAFLQGSSSLSQDLTGLIPGKQYWIQFSYDARNCCGGTIDLVTRFNGADLDKIVNVRPVTGGKPYVQHSVTFKPDSDAGTLTIATIASLDATINLDGVTIVQRDEGNAIVANPSFEASGAIADPGVVSPAAIAGWTGEGTYGIATVAGQMANNGTIPDQGNAAFISGVGSLTQAVPDLGVGKQYTVSFAYNARTGNKPHLQVKAGATILFETDVDPVGGVAAYRTKSVTFAATDPTANITFAQTKDGDQTVLLDDIRVQGEVQKPLPPLLLAPTRLELAPGQKTTVSVTVPTELLALKDATIKIRSMNSSVAAITGADDTGTIELPFKLKGSNVQTVEILAVGPGLTSLEVTETAGLKLADAVSISIVTSFVRNPSFEGNSITAANGYGAILAWEGGSGLNLAAGPFHDNGVIPDRTQVAFLQNSTSLSQEIAGLVPGQTYWLQFRYNVRNCCGGTIDLTAKFNDVELTKIAQITPVGEQNEYYLANVPFVPAKASGKLVFTTIAVGDATVLLDAVNIVRRETNDIVVQNPSFEASGAPPYPGYIQPNGVAGWTMTGGYGVNLFGVGPFTDNGVGVDQDSALFLQGTATASQNITGLTAGKKYTLIYAVNARNCCGSAENPGVTRYRMSFADEQLVEEIVEPVGAGNPYYTKYVVFTASGAEGVLRFEGAPEGDHTLLLDNIRILPGVVEPQVEANLHVATQVDGKLRLSWPASATGFGLEAAVAINGPWAADNSAVTVDGVNNVVTLNNDGKTKFYRLRK